MKAIIQIAAMLMLVQVIRAADPQIYSLIAHNGDTTVWVSFDDTQSLRYYGKSQGGKAATVVACDLNSIGDREFLIEVSPLSISVIVESGMGPIMYLTRNAKPVLPADLRVGIMNAIDGNWAACFVTNSTEHFPRDVNDFERLTVDRVRVIANAGVTK